MNHIQELELTSLVGSWLKMKKEMMIAHVWVLFTEVWTLENERVGARIPVQFWTWLVTSKGCGAGGKWKYWSGAQGRGLSQKEVTNHSAPHP